MPYNPPNIFVNGTELLASELQENQEVLRDYINANIVSTDIAPDTFNTSDLQEGEPVAVTDDFIFMTGDQYSFYKVDHLSTTAERLWHTSTVKRFKPMEKIRWQSVPSLAKQFYMEDSGSALIEIGFFADEEDNDDCRGAVYPWNKSPPAGTSRSSGQDSQYQLVIDGVLTTADIETTAYSYSEGGSTTITFGTFSNMVNQQNYQGGTTGQRKWISILYLATGLSQGWHQISVVVNACNEKGYVSHRMMCIETFYDMGYNATSPSSIATNRKLPETLF